MPVEVYGRKLWRTHVCKTCKREFQASRIDAQYCSGRCRVYWQRHGVPYSSVGTPLQVGPGLFDESEKGPPVLPEVVDFMKEVVTPIIESLPDPVTLPVIAEAVTKKHKPKKRVSMAKQKTTSKKPKSNKPATNTKGAKKDARKK